MKKKINAKEPTNFDTLESIDYIWAVLTDYRESHLNKFDNEDDIWDEIATSMAWIEEEIGLKHGKPINEGYPEWKLEKTLKERDGAMQRFTKQINERSSK